MIVYFNPEQDRKAAVINPSGFKNFWGSKNSGAKKSGEIQCEIIRTKKRKKSKTNQNSDRSNDNKDQESFIWSLNSDWSVNEPIISEQNIETTKVFKCKKKSGIMKIISPFIITLLQ